jgi:hypothetical protein
MIEIGSVNPSLSQNPNASQQSSEQPIKKEKIS